MAVHRASDEGDDLARRRETLIMRLEYLLVEIDALGPLLEQLPGEILAARPFDEPSAIDFLTGLAERDRRVVKAASGNEAPAGDLDADAQIDEVLRHLLGARQALLEVLADRGSEGWKDMVEWTGDAPQPVVDLAACLADEDLRVLRALGERLRTANLFGRMPH